jgi:hypothetical protein
MSAKIQKIQEVTEDDVANPAEVAQVFEIVFAAIFKIREDADTLSGDLRRTIREKTAELTRELNAIRKDGNTSYQSLKKVVDSIVKWREKEMTRELDEEIAAAHERADDAHLAIDEIRAALKTIKAQQGKPGKPGRMPDHEWDGTRIRFELPDGEWGEWVDLIGPAGGGGFSLFGAGMGGVRRIRAGTGITISGDPGEPTISSNGGGTGSTISIEVPSDAINDVNRDFVFTAKPLVIVMNQGTYRNDAVNGWTWSAGTLTATMPSVPGTGGDIYGLIQT